MQILVPISICVVLPIAIVWLLCHASINKDNKRTEVLLKAIETNNGIDCDKLAEAMSKPQKTAREISNQRLLRGCIFTLLGSGLLIFVILSSLFGAMRDDPFLITFVSGAVSLAIGIGYLIVYFVSRKYIKD